MEETISLKELFQTLKKRLALIFMITALATAASGVVSYFFLTPIYQASTQILVNQSKNEQQAYQFNEIQTNIQLINTYSVIMKSPAIMDKVEAQLKTELSEDAITVASEKDSQVFTVTVEDENPAQAVKIANATANVFQSEIKNIMKIDNVSILSKATSGEDPSPVKPQPVLNMAIALVVGLMAGVGIAFLLEYLDNTIKTEQDIEKLLELPILGAITTITEDMEAAGPSQKQSYTKARGETYGA
ncbi:capsular biosynthesis protein [Bacillus mangrovi]|uniref:Capsular biosynthesis protein n=1 Tax=Metabacillus mangrovi TaxID=1491830 RepID=A0A7X2S6P4_9BACI|nr:Wzz/FepE/Etk N-terminal domain-containing protein [Metabacillus mangrovi]MTH54500.1 capsular biosynthesis protein [Metabacillus mangrovi]